MPEKKAELLDVTAEQLKTGVQLKAGHQVVLIVGGLGHAAQPDEPGVPAEPGDPDAPQGQQAEPGQPGTAEPGTAKPGTAQPDTPQPGTAQPDAPQAGAQDDKRDDPPAPPPVPHDALAVQIVSASGAPQKSLEYEVALPDGSKRAGKTDGSGKLLLDDLPKDAQCTLTIPDVKAGKVAGQPALGRVAYQPGMQVRAGANSIVELPPRVRRGELTGMHFETAKTFLLPSAMPGIRQLRSLYDSYGADLAVLVSGHTDTVGPAGYNRGLSDERARSIASFLTDDADGWIKFYAGQAHSDKWGVREDQYMLATLGQAVAVDGGLGSQTRAAYKAFQSSKGLPATGSPDQATRRALVTDYMAQDGTSLPKGAKLSSHGCGFSHLKVKTPPNTANAENRRVEIYLFEGEVTPPPKASCPQGGCAEYPQWEAQTESTVDLDQPPGSASVKVVDGAGAPIPDAEVHLSGIVTLDARTGADGSAAFDGVVPGKYQVIADKEGFTAADAEVEVASGQAAVATLTLEPLLRTLRVVVQDDAKPAKPVTGAQVTIDAPGAAAQTTGSDGVALFEKLKPGKVHVKAIFKDQVKEGDAEILQTKAKSAPAAQTKLGITGGDVVQAVDGAVDFVITLLAQLANPTVKLTDFDPRGDLDGTARERDWTKDTLTFKNTGASGSPVQVSPPGGTSAGKSVDVTVPNSAGATFELVQVSRAGPASAPIIWSLEMTGPRPISVPPPARVGLAARARVSTWFNAFQGMVQTPSTKDPSTISPTFRGMTFDGLDDVTFLATVVPELKNGAATGNWFWHHKFLGSFGGPIGGQPDDAKCKAFMKEALDLFHKNKVQVLAGVFLDTGVQDNPKFSDPLIALVRQTAKGVSGKAAIQAAFAPLATSLVDFFDSRALDIDGISFDWETGGAGAVGMGAGDKDAVEGFYCAVAAELAKKSRFLAYATPAFAATPSFMAEQPYDLARDNKDFIARAMSYDSAGLRKKTTQFGLGTVGMLAAELQVGWDSRTDGATIAAECDKQERTFRTGVIFFASGGSSSFDKFKNVDARLNPNLPPRGTLGQPLQAPLAPARIAVMKTAGAKWSTPDGSDPSQTGASQTQTGGS